MKLILITVLMGLFASTSFAQIDEWEAPEITWEGGNSCTQANEKEVDNLVSDKMNEAKEKLQLLTSAVQTWADGKEEIEGVIVQSGINFTAVPTLHALEGAANGIQVLSKNADRFLGYSFDAVNCIADDLTPRGIRRSKNLSPEMKETMKGSRSAVNCIVEFGGTVTSLIFLSSAELVQNVGGAVNNIVSDVFTGLALPLEYAGDYFLDKDGRMAQLVGEGFYLVLTFVNNVETVISGGITVVVVAVNTGAEIAVQVICGTARSLKKFFKYLKKGRPFKALAALAKGICKAIKNGVFVAIKGFKRILAIMKDVFQKVAPAGLSQDEVELIMDYEPQM